MFLDDICKRRWFIVIFKIEVFINEMWWSRFFVISTLFCCSGFIYKIQVQRQQHGIDALLGMTILSACLETVSNLSKSIVCIYKVNCMSHYQELQDKMTSKLLF
ncbi:hypothetical protein HanHA300_Chr13g0502771 [Helianthus annuus]|nr:hypothetical protein HanHA300_Chr13g0502771 [Helianthus annuus]KAJ0499569.1 hypothetical protein HanHA89_Chr13g0535491 [Helianthus annuus]KAJ0665583.1 hypothetical protein HanLR1_Chr13g0505481 [Helianthus annuus]KAJ0673030.1 hypothetical protein HanOQP8_Chr13g0503701 [Helianthus annuus]